MGFGFRLGLGGDFDIGSGVVVAVVLLEEIFPLLPLNVAALSVASPSIVSDVAPELVSST